LIRFFSLLITISLFSGLSSLAQPTFTAGTDVTVDQNFGSYSGSWATNINAVTPVFEIQISTPNNLTFAADPVIDATGNLTFEPTLNRSGSAIITVILRDLNSGETSIPASFRIIVNFINSPPTFNVPVPDQTIDEDDGPQAVLAWATDIDPGPNPEEVTQDIAFTTTVVTKSAYMTFVANPVVDNSGNLFYEVAGDANGTATIEVYLEDDGSNTPPSSNKSAGVSFTITVNAINDPPSFNFGENIRIDEHHGPFLQENWATNISAGPPDEEATQTVSFVVTEKSITTYLQYDTPVSVDENGALSFQATPHYNGVAIYEIYLIDDGSSVPPNNNKSATIAFTVSVDFVNDQPTFDVGTDIVIDEGDNTETFPDWATNISPGLSPNEQDQKLLFTVVFNQVTGSLAFLRAPEIDETGLLIFRATQHTHGEAIFDVYLTDDGDFNPPNDNESEKKTFKITVTKVNYPPNDLILSNTTILEKQGVGAFVGSFSTADLDPEDTHNYALVPGDGSDDNDSFMLDGEDLLTNEEFDWEVKRRYSIRVKTSDGEFSLEKSFTITVDKLIEGVKFANAITPNGDGENDTWELEDIEAYPDVTVFIYDTAGQNVFKSKQGYNPWDGTFNGRQLPMGTYYYIIDLHDGINVYKGTITIIL